jgi:flagellar M-ring protein FliF
MEGSASRGSWVGGLFNVGIVRQVGLMIGLSASVAVGFAVILWSQEPDYRVLFSNVDFSDSNTVIEQLSARGIEHKFDPTGRTILVPEESLHEARLALASEGFSNEKTQGFEMLTGDQPLASSQFMEVARYRQALQGELARTIMSMTAVRLARVHLAFPKESSFVRDKTKPRASVFLEIASGRKLEPNQVDAISHLIVGSIPELAIEDVSIIDQRGRLLNSKGKNGEVEIAGKQLVYIQKIEEKLLNRVNSIVSPLVGFSNFQAEISAEVDFTQIEQADERYSQDPSVIRSEQSMEEMNGIDTSTGGIPGATSNVPPGNAKAPEVLDQKNDASEVIAKGNSRSQTVKNYEVDRKVSYTKYQTGQVKRISVAVVLNSASLIAGDGENKAKEWTDEEIEGIEKLVKNAIGFSEERGDSVTVLASDFFQEQIAEDIEINIWEEGWFWNVVKQVFAGILVIVLIVGVLRPILISLASNNKKEKEKEQEEPLTLKIDDGVNAVSPLTFEEQLITLKTMVAEDPAKVAQTIKQWVKIDD